MDLFIIAKEGVEGRAKQPREAVEHVYQPRGWKVIGPAASDLPDDVRTAAEAAEPPAPADPAPEQEPAEPPENDKQARNSKPTRNKSKED